MIISKIRIKKYNKNTNSWGSLWSDCLMWEGPLLSWSALTVLSTSGQLRYVHKETIKWLLFCPLAFTLPGKLLHIWLLQSPMISESADWTSSMDIRSVTLGIPWISNQVGWATAGFSALQAQDGHCQTYVQDHIMYVRLRLALYIFTQFYCPR